MDGGFVVRAATIDDLEGLVGLARMSGPGFTSLPDDAAYLGARLRSAAAAFGGDAPEEGPEEGARDFLLILEDSAGAVVGCAAVKAGASQVPDEASFINFHHHRPAGRDDRGAERLEVSRAFSGATEVGSLFVAAVARGGGVGRLLAQSRGFLLAVAPAQFGHVVIAELRGVVDAQGRSPFWDAVGARLFATTFEAADRRLGTEGLAPFVAQLPKAPIDVATLPDGARAVIGSCHTEGLGALKMLEWEGFEPTELVDLFDAGPIVSAPLRDLRTVRESRRVIAALDVGGGAGAPILIGNDRLASFRVALAPARLTREAAYISKAWLDRLDVRVGDVIRVWSAAAP